MMESSECAKIYAENMIKYGRADIDEPDIDEEREQNAEYNGWFAGIYLNQSGDGKITDYPVSVFLPSGDDRLNVDCYIEGLKSALKEKGYNDSEQEAFIRAVFMLDSEMNSGEFIRNSYSVGGIGAVSCLVKVSNKNLLEMYERMLISL